MASVPMSAIHLESIIFKDPLASVRYELGSNVYKGSYARRTSHSYFLVTPINLQAPCAILAILLLNNGLSIDFQSGY